VDDSLSIAEARRIAIAAQGLATPRPASAGPAEVIDMVRRLGVVQIDSVNVLARSHYLPGWSRLGAYAPADLDALVHRAPRSVFEYWGHEASLLPVELHPVLRWRMARAIDSAWRHVRRIARRKKLVADVLAIVKERGPIGAREISLGRPSRKGWWEWSDAKSAIEWLFWSGQVTSASRRGFERLYDLPERVLPAQIIAAPTPAEADAQRILVEQSARALGIATEADLRDYFRLKPATARPAIAALEQAGVIREVSVEGTRAYLHRDAVMPEIDRDRAALLSPFDSLVWFRQRTERWFGMRFRLEIYVPKHLRVHGYYVLPLLLGDRLVGRVDLKADRAARKLLVQAAHAEPGAPRTTASALHRELVAMASWLGLDGIEIIGRTALSGQLRRRR
jgi:uncharacterized protein YcaQ